MGGFSIWHILIFAVIVLLLFVYVLGGTLGAGLGATAPAGLPADAGRDAFEQAYDDLAVSALRFLAETGGEQLVGDFARRRVGELEERYRPLVAAAAPGDRATALARALSADGYAASAQASPTASGEQLCQHHCPVAHVAERFPQLCEAEMNVFTEALGTYAQRLATIARGDSFCTTFVPAVHGSRTVAELPMPQMPPRQLTSASAD